MTFYRVALLPLEVCCERRKATRIRKSRLARLSMSTGIALFALSEIALANAPLHTSPKRKDHPQALALWSPPPGDRQWVQHDTQLGAPNAAFTIPEHGLYTNASFESARDIHIQTPATLYTHTDTTLHLSGIVSSNSDSSKTLSKYGLGTLILSGQNTYQGNTFVHEGTLHVAGNRALSDSFRILNIYSGTTLSYAPGAVLYNNLQTQAGSDTSVPIQWRVDSGTATQVGTVLGPVPVIKQGAGTLLMTGSGTSSAPLVVNQGTLALGHFLQRPIQVNAGARLAGNGSVGATTVLAGGTLAPGLDASPGRLVMPQLTMQPGATLQVRTLANGDADSLFVLGTAQLNGQVLAHALPGDWQANTRYTLVHAMQGLDDTRFASAATNLPFLDPHLSYDPQNAYLTLVRNGLPMEDVGGTPDEDEVAKVIDDGNNPDLHDKVLTLDRDNARAAFNQLSGNWNASIASRLLEDSRFIRLAALANAQPATGDTALSGHGGRVWHHAFYSSAQRRAQQGVAGDTRHTHGLVLGGTRPLGNTWHASAYAGVQHSQLDRSSQGATQARIDTQHLGLALARAWKELRWMAGAAYSWHQITSQRNLTVPGLADMLSSRYKSRTLQLFTEAVGPYRWPGQPVPDAPALPQDQAHDAAPDRVMSGVAPFARLAWVQGRTQAYTEQGGSAALGVNGANHGVLFTTLGLKARHTLHTPTGTAQLQGELAWRHTGGDVQVNSRQHFRDSTQQTRFTSDGQPLLRHAVMLRLGLDANLGKNGKLGFAYAGLYGSRQQDHGAQVEVAWRF